MAQAKVITEQELKRALGMGKILADNLRLWIDGEKLEKVFIDRTL